MHSDYIFEFIQNTLNIRILNNYVISNLHYTWRLISKEKNRIGTIFEQYASINHHISQQFI